MLFISRNAARDAAIAEVAGGRAEAFHIERRFVRQSDRSFEYGWRVALYRRHRFIGFCEASQFRKVA